MLSRLDPTIENYDIFHDSHEWNPDFKTFLEQIIGCSIVGEKGREAIEKKLADKREFTKASFVKLISLIKTQEDKVTLLIKSMRNTLTSTPTPNSNSADKSSESSPPSMAVSVIREDNEELRGRLSQLQDELNAIHGQHKVLTEEAATFRDQLHSVELRNKELEDSVEGLKFDLQKITRQHEKAKEMLKNANAGTAAAAAAASSSGSAAASGVKSEPGADAVQSQLVQMDSSEIEDLKTELEIEKERNSKRLKELEQVRNEKIRLQQEFNALRMNLGSISEEKVMQTPYYCILHTQYSLAVKDALEAKAALERFKQDLSQSVLTRRGELESLENAEKQRVMQIRDRLQRQESEYVRMKNEIDRLTYELERKAANSEQSHVNQEMRQLISNLQNNNSSLKAEVLKYRSRCDDLTKKVRNLGGEVDAISRRPSISGVDAEVDIDELKAQLKRSLEKQKEVELLLNVYKTSSKENRSFTDILHSERKLLSELNSLKQKMATMQENSGGDGGASGAKQASGTSVAASDDKSKDEQIAQLKAHIEELETTQEALSGEMENIGRYYEDMLEQNSRLIVQINAKEDSSFQLMSEQRKQQQIQKDMSDERDLLKQKVALLEQHRDQSGEMLRKLEDRERNLKEQLASTEKEVWLKQSIVEAHKKKAVEAAQTAHITRLQLDKVESDLSTLTVTLKEKTEIVETVSHDKNRIEDELSVVMRRMEKYKKYGNNAADEMLQEQLKTYKEMLHCSVCHTRQKNCVLTKCGHSFCFECIQTRYDTRQRKCPSCGDTFGANDYHQMYLV
eukprot:Nk52_evm30s2449 gene=Nk52_evmTU30s2449